MTGSFHILASSLFGSHSNLSLSKPQIIEIGMLQGPVRKPDGF
jgi:hypothetical protein